MVAFTAFLTIAGLLCTTNALPSLNGRASLSIKQTVSSTFSYAGCYVDTSPRVLAGKAVAGNSMTLEACATFCSTWPYFGVEYGRECYCGTSLSATKASDSDCTAMACNGNSAESCGSGWRIQAYSSIAGSTTSAGAATSTPSLQGCYSDNYPKSRILSGPSTSQVGMTTAKCQAFCSASGYSLFGTEYAQECYCGNSIMSDGSTYGVSASGCTMACSGDSKALCGGSNRVLVYSLSSTAKVVSMASSSTSTKSSTSIAINMAKTSLSTTSSAASSSTTSKASTTSSTTSSTSSTSKSTTSSKTTSSTTSAPSSTTPTKLSGKRGLPYNDAALANLFATTQNTQISWAYNWASSSSWGTSKLSTLFNFVPMLWGLKSDLTSAWSTNLAASIAAGSTHALGFNEPDLNVQSNMTPAQAAAAWRQYIEPYAGKIKLGAPAVTNGGDPMGLTWLSQFMSACSGCTIDFVPIHWYDSATNLGYFKWYMQQAIAAAGGRPVWITEFSGSGTQAQQIAMLQTVMPWLDSQPLIERYAWFMAGEGMLTANGAISPLGAVYMNYTAVSTF